MKKIQNLSLAEAVYERVKAMIVHGELMPGTLVNKKELAETLSVSMTPVNEAISRLAGEKLIQQRDRQGLYIRSFDDRALADLYAVRAGLEAIAIRLCVMEGSGEDLKRLELFFQGYTLPVPASRTREYTDEDMAFHTTIMEIARIPMLADIEGFYGYMKKSYSHGLMREPSDTLNEHRSIIEAVKRKDAQLACELMMAHHLKSRERLLSLNSTSF